MSADIIPLQPRGGDAAPTIESMLQLTASGRPRRYLNAVAQAEEEEEIEGDPAAPRQGLKLTS